MFVTFVCWSSVLVRACPLSKINRPVSQGINLSANFRFLSIQSTLFGFVRDESRQEVISCRQSRQGVIFSRTIVLEGSKRSRTVLADAKYDGQSQQEAKNGGVLFTL